MAPSSECCGKFHLKSSVLFANSCWSTHLAESRAVSWALPPAPAPSAARPAGSGPVAGSSGTTSRRHTPAPRESGLGSSLARWPEPCLPVGSDRPETRRNRLHYSSSPSAWWRINIIMIISAWTHDTQPRAEHTCVWTEENGAVCLRVCGWSEIRWMERATLFFIEGSQGIHASHTNNRTRN